jgi:peptidylprolyl isomerase
MSGPSKKKKQTKPEKDEGKTGGLSRKNLMMVGGVIAFVAIFVIVIFILPNPVVAAKGDNVSVYYTLKLEDGTIFDSNINDTPLAFTVGSAGIIPGFSNAIIGMKVNQDKTVDIPSDQAYGPYRSDRIRVVNRTGLLANQTFMVGEYYTIHSAADNTDSMIRVLNVTPTTLTVDANSPLAGQNLTFTVHLVSLKKGAGGTGAGTSVLPVPTTMNI